MCPVSIYADSEFYDNQNESALALISEALMANTEELGLDCEEELEKLGKEVLAVTENKKLYKSAKAKSVKSFFKLLEVRAIPQLFKEASEQVANQICEEEEDELVEDPDDGEFVDEEPGF